MTDPCGALKVLGPTDVDDYTPALYNYFPTSLADVWARVTVRDFDLVQEAVFVLGFTEWVNDPGYYGDWWLTGGIALLTETTSLAASSTNWNMSGTPESETVGYSPTGRGYGVYDLRVKFVDVVGGYSRFDTEVWHDDVKEWSQRQHCQFDTGKPAFTGVQALTIFNRYAESHSLFLDDISVGTTRGASDIMGPVTFDDGMFGAFTVDDGDTGGMVDSFSVSPPCRGQRFQAIIV